MQVLLTGATGLIGPRVLDLLVKRGDSVRVLALPDTVDAVGHRDVVKVFEGSFDDTDTLAKASRGVEVVYHLGARVLGSGHTDLMHVNVQGTENLLNAVKGRVRRFVFTSSVAVYSPAPFPFMWPIVETSPLKAHGSDELRNYGQSKIDGENMILRTHGEKKLEYVILRPPAVYSSESPWVAQLVQKLLQNPWQAFSRNAQHYRMQWVHVSDLARAIVLAGIRPTAANNVFNVAGDELFTQRDILRITRELISAPQQQQRTGSQHGSAIFAGQPHTNGHYGLKYDISKAQRMLGYAPKVQLRKGLMGVTAKIDRGQLFGPKRWRQAQGVRPKGW